jgi:hypothetical protein
VTPDELAVELVHLASEGLEVDAHGADEGSAMRERGEEGADVSGKTAFQTS